MNVVTKNQGGFVMVYIPEEHNRPYGAHRQVHQPVLIQVHLAMDATAKVLEARRKISSSNSLKEWRTNKERRKIER